MEEFQRFDYTDKKKCPPFEYVVITDSHECDLCDYVDYYLFNDFDRAYNQLKTEIAKGKDMATLYTIHFNTVDRTYRLAKSFFHRYGHGIVFDDRPDVELHVAFYINAGRWLNPEEKL